MLPENDGKTNDSNMSSETTPIRFVPDYLFATSAEIKAVTTKHLASLEAELHTVRMAYVINGRQADIPVRANATIGSEIIRLEASIKELREYFEAVLED